MIRHIVAVMALVAATAATAQVGIERNALGSGSPGTSGYEQALPVLENNIFHAPQYLPFYPTAASIWPRIVTVSCEKGDIGLRCDGYHWLPKYGRGEYLFFMTKVEEPVKPVKPVKPVVIIKEIPGPRVLVEVPVKKKKE